MNPTTTTAPTTHFDRPATMSVATFEHLQAVLDSAERHKVGATASSATYTRPAILAKALRASGESTATEADLAGLPQPLRDYVLGKCNSYEHHRWPTAIKKAAEARRDEAYVRQFVALRVVAEEIYELPPHRRVKRVQELMRDMHRWPPPWKERTDDYGDYYMPPDSLVRRVLAELLLIEKPRPRRRT